MIARLYILRMCIVLAFACLGTACATLQQMIGFDPDPPDGYRPRFIKAVRPFDPNNLDDAALEISRAEPIAANKLKLYMHVIDTNGYYLTGSTSSKFKKIWCEVIDSSETERRIIKTFAIREVNKTERKPQAIALVMDFSGSMGKHRANAVQQAAHNFIAQIKKPEDAVALVKYDHRTVVESPLTQSAEKLLAQLHSKEGLTGYGGQTATFTAIAKGIKEVMKTDASRQRVVIVFTDGNDNASLVTKEDVIRLARETNTIVCAIDYGYSIGEKYMEEIARKTNGTYNHIYARTEFDLVFKDIYRRFEDYYLLEFEQADFGFHATSVKLCLPDKKNTSLSAAGSYDNTPYPGSVSLLNVVFDSDKSTLKPQSDNAIRQLFQLLQKDSTIKIELRGHTDSQNNTKDPEHNIKLSQRRADAVRGELIKRGINGERIVAKGFGEKQPVADNATAEGRSQNRRTEFAILAPSHVDYVDALLLLPPKSPEKYQLQPIYQNQ